MKRMHKGHENNTQKKCENLIYFKAYMQIKIIRSFFMY